MREMNGGKQMRNLWEIPLTPRSEKWAGEHPTQKPLELLKRIILACTREGDTVLDPFLGSGTTSVVAEMYGRNSIGMEKNHEYIPMLRKRLERLKEENRENNIDIKYVDLDECHGMAGSNQ